MIDVLVGLDEDSPTSKPEFYGFVDDLHRQPNSDQWIEVFDILRIEPDATMTHQSTHAPWKIGTVDSIAVEGEGNPMGSEGIFRPRGNRCSSMFPPETGWNVPRGVLYFTGDVKGPKGGSSIQYPDSYGISLDHLYGFDEEIAPHLRDINDNAFVPGFGAYPHGGDFELYSLRRNP